MYRTRQTPAPYIRTANASRKHYGPAGVGRLDRGRANFALRGFYEVRRLRRGRLELGCPGTVDGLRVYDGLTRIRRTRGHTLEVRDRHRRATFHRARHPERPAAVPKLLGRATHAIVRSFVVPQERHPIVLAVRRLEANDRLRREGAGRRPKDHRKGTGIVTKAPGPHRGVGTRRHHHGAVRWANPCRTGIARARGATSCLRVAQAAGGPRQVGGVELTGVIGAADGICQSQTTPA